VPDVRGQAFRGSTGREAVAPPDRRVGARLSGMTVPKDGNPTPVMNLKSYFESRSGQDLQLRLQNSAEIRGRVIVVGDDIVGLENDEGTTMLVPFSAIAFTRTPTSTVLRLAHSA
jgi:hypothetical protein